MAGIRAEILNWLSAIWRRRWLAIGLAWCLCAIGWTVVCLLPSRYESEARIYLDTDTLLGPLLRNLAVENDLQRRVQIMQRTLLSRPNLQQVIAATDLGLRARTAADEEDIASGLERAIRINAQGPNLFSIAYIDSNAVRARDVVQALITVLVESNSGQNRSEMEKARTFIEKQIASYEAQLRAIEGKMADFKAAHVEELSSNGGDFGSRLEMARQAKETARAALAESETRYAQLQAQLRAISPFIEVETPPQVIVTNGNPLATRIAEAQSNLSALRLKFTDKHPDVQAAQKALDDLIAQQANSDKTSQIAQAHRGRISNPVYEQLQLRLLDAEQAVQLARSHLAQCETDEKRLIGLAGSAPAVEAEFADLTRNYGVEKKNFEELLARREAARISEAVENSSNKIEFRLIQPPTVPPKPIGPNRALFVCLVLVGSIAASCGLIVLHYHIEQPLTSAEALLQLFDLPVLGTVSLVASPETRRNELRQAVRFGLVGSSLIIVFLGLLTLSFMRTIEHDSTFFSQRMEGSIRHAG